MSPSTARTPVLVGIGLATRHEEDWRRALEPMDLMLEAVRAAGRDAGSAALLAGAGYVAVPRGRWRYRNPAGEVARAVGAGDASTALATVGVLQQTLIGEACARIARGEIHTAIVTGADAGYRLLRAQLAGEEAQDRDHDDEPRELLAPKEELRHPVEKRAGLVMPVGLYAIIESAFRARHGWSVPEHRERLARLYARMSEIAAANPHAWQRTALTPAAIRDAGPRNPMQAYPYTRAHVTSWNVDQAAALVLCSAARADELGIAPGRRVYALASTESNHMVPVSARDELGRCPGAALCGEAALDSAGLSVDALDLVELYSCFPVAVETYAEALGLPLTRDLTVTGGMPFAGGPYNNYVLQATARAAELLRATERGTALVGSVSGVLTKQGFGLWSRQAPATSFLHADLSAAVAAAIATRPVRDGHVGGARVAGYTVLHGRGQSPRALALLDTTDGARVLADSADPALAARFEQEEFVGRELRVDGTRLVT